MYQIDALVTLTLNSLAGTSALLDLVMVWISAIGVPFLVVLVAAQWWRRVDRQHVRHTLVAAALSFLLGLGMNQFLLVFVHRVRPYDAGVTQLLIPPSADWSFPPDHATATMATTATFLLHRLPRTGVAFLTASLVMMVSRVFVGTHYVTDLFGGGLTGFAGAVVVWQLYQEGTRIDKLVTGIF